MIRSRTNNITQPIVLRADDVTEQQLALGLATNPAPTIPCAYNPLVAQQLEIDRLRASCTMLANENQELHRLIQLQATEHRQFREEVMASIAALRIDELRSSYVSMINEQQRLLQSRTPEQQFREEVMTNIADLRQQQQSNKQAIAFLYDKLQEVNTVAFKTGNCDVHGTRLPIPYGFEQQHCSFFTASYGNYRGSAPGDVVPAFHTQDAMVMPYSGNCDLRGGAYGVWAAKPIISEQEVIAKKNQYRLMI
jgi:hypothetical protein